MFWEEEEPYGRIRRGRREEEDGGAKIKQAKVWNLDFGMELYGFVWISCLDICLWVVGNLTLE